MADVFFFIMEIFSQIFHFIGGAINLQLATFPQRLMLASLLLLSSAWFVTGLMLF